MSFFTVRRLLLVAPVVLLLSARVLAQPVTSISGTVQDQSGGVIPGAVVLVVDAANGHSVTTTADARGHFTLTGLNDGLYEISAVATGFESGQQRMQLNASSHESVTLTLAVAPQRAVVDVTGYLAPQRPDVENERVRTSDTAALLDGLPGLSVAGNGGVSSIPAIHGLADDRVKLSINGMTLAPACSGHMNPPLSYIDPASLASVKVMAGITPVSAGGDSIGGTVIVESPKPQFAGSGTAVHASASVFARSNSRATGGNASFSAATDHLRIGYVGSYADAANYTAGGGQMVKSTFYTTANHALQVALSDGTQSLTADINVQRIPEQGFANARMDMRRNDATLGNVRYERNSGWGRLDARAYVEHTQHEMNVLRDKVPGMNMPMDTEGQNLGYSVTVDRRLGRHDTVHLGSDLHRFTLDDWWPGVMAMVGSMGPDTLQNINDGRRTRVGNFGEWESQRGALGHGVDPAQGMGRRRNLVRRRTHPQRRPVRNQGFEAAEPGAVEIIPGPP